MVLVARQRRGRTNWMSWSCNGLATLNKPIAGPETPLEHVIKLVVGEAGSYAIHHLNLDWTGPWIFMP